MTLNFDNEFKTLNKQIGEMSTFVNQALSNCFKAFESYDLALAEKIIKADDLVDDAENKAHQTALKILSMQLNEDFTRKVSTSLKVITDMERIADQCADIAEILLYYKKSPMQSDLSYIFRMFDTCIQMVDGSIKAFINEDLGTAARIITMDDIVDGLFGDIRDIIVDMLLRDRGLADEAVDLIMKAKYLERIADHAVNIAEWAIFVKEGK